MKYREYREPNVSCLVELNGKTQKWVTYTTDPEGLKAHLIEIGYAGALVEPFEYSSWLVEIETAKKELHRSMTAGDQPTFKPSLWQRHKRHLFDLFDGCCAYCECLVGQIAHGEVEHYRPKRKPEEATAHPGYFWLAYSPLNLLPCCSYCNGARGKSNHFPVKGQHATSESAVLHERPLLLNPLLIGDDPQLHLDFTRKPEDADRVSTVRELSPRGYVSWNIYQLNRPDLQVYRRERQRSFITDVNLARLLNDHAKRNMLIRAAKTGKRECSAACVAALPSWIDEIEKAGREQIEARRQDELKALEAEISEIRGQIVDAPPNITRD